jgi:hypothetical protein
MNDSLGDFIVRCSERLKDAKVDLAYSECKDTTAKLYKEIKQLKLILKLHGVNN